LPPWESVVKLLWVMSVSRDPATPVAGPRVTFEVERFAWLEGGRLEVVGRWFGIRGRRFLRPTLDVDVDGEPRRMLALLEHKPWAADDGEKWIAAFEWTGEPVALEAAELAVGSDLAVELPAPSGAPRPKRRARATADRLEARPPRTQALEAELAAARAEAEELRGELTAERRTREKLAEEVRELRRERADGQTAATELEKARDAALAERDAASAERDSSVAEREAAVAEREAARAEAAAAASEREKAIRERAALEHELTAAQQARDKARQERNAWLTRARAAADKDGPPGAKRREPEAEAPRGGPEPAADAPRAARDAPAPGPAPPAPAPTGEAAPAREAAPPPPPAPAHEAAPPPPPAPAREAAPPPPAADRPRRRVRLPREARKPLPPGGILMPPDPGSHTRRSIVPSWGPRLLVPLALVVLLLVVVLLIAWAF
jgi:hypothetical protein